MPERGWHNRVMNRSWAAPRTAAEAALGVLVTAPVVGWYMLSSDFSNSDTLGRDSFLVYAVMASALLAVLGGLFERGRPLAFGLIAGLGLGFFGAVAVESYWALRAVD